MYLDSFDIFVKSLSFHFYPSVFFLKNFYKNCYLGRIVYVNSTSFLVDFGGGFYLRYTASDLEYHMYLVGYMSTNLLGKSVLLLFSMESADTYFSLIYYRNHFVRKKNFDVFLRNACLFSDMFPICNLVVLKWFRYRKRVWAGMCGWKILIR